MSQRFVSAAALEAFVAAYRVPGDLLPDDGSATTAMRRTLTMRYGMPRVRSRGVMKFWDLASGTRTESMGEVA